MSMLTRWNPFKSAASPIAAMQDFDELFRGLGSRALMRDMELAPDIRIDVDEDDTSFRVSAEIPGVDKDDISVTVEGGQVSISAELKRESYGKDQNRIHSERSFGRAFRSFSLPCEVDQEKAEARYEKGVLHLTLPKRPNGSSRRIAIS